MSKMNGKLKTKIFRNMFALAIVFIFLSASLTTMILYRNMEEQTINSNKTVATYIQHLLNTYGESHIKNLNVPSDERITLIAQDGTVLYDSMASSDVMGNHLDRPEIAQAFENGSGFAKRVSDTLDETSYYYAVLLKNGDVLRVSTTLDSMYAAFWKILPGMIVICLFIVLIAFVVADYQTKKIVNPINSINIQEPERVEVYDEFAPFVTRIHKQNKVIQEQMESLKAKQIEFETITENMEEGLIVLGKKGKVLSYNSSAIKLLGIENHTEPLTNILQFNRTTSLQNVMEQALGGERAEEKLVIKSRICQLIANPVKDEQKITGAVVLVMDITEREKNEAMRREFSANVSHELKTPLTAISGYAEIMKSGIAKDKDMRKFAEIIYNESARMIQLVGDIIRISKLDEGNVQAEKTEFDLMKMVTQIKEHLSLPALEKRVTIAITGEEKQYRIHSVEAIVEEMLFNVVDNAVKYNKKGGKIRISLWAEQKKTIVKVEDTGIGIPAEDIPRVFERFYRVDKSHSREIGGTGLGLSIVKHGAAFTNTNVKMESVEGKGTTVYLEFQE